MKKVSALLLTAIMLLGLAACGAAPSEPEKPAEPVVEEPVSPQESVLGTEPVEITFWHCASDEAGVLMDKYISDFNAANEYGITVSAVYQGQYSDATTLLKTMLSGNNYGDLPDIMQLDATGKTTYYSSGRAFTVDDAVAAYGDASTLDAYLEGALGNWQFKGCQLGLPFATSTTVTYYNKTLLEEAGFTGAPDTFADLAAIADAMKAKGMSQSVFRCIPNTPTLANWLGQLGSYLVDNSNGTDDTASGLACMENGALAAFLTEWKALYDAGALENENASNDAFLAGEVAVLTNSSSHVNEIITGVDGRFEVGVSGYLRVNDSAAAGASLSGSCLVLFDSGSELKKQAAFCFMQYLTSAEVQADYAANTGYIPANVGALDDPAYAAVTSASPQYLAAFEQISATPAHMRSVTVGPATDFYYAIIQDISDMLEYGQTVEETAEIMEEDLNSLLGDYLRNN